MNSCRLAPPARIASLALVVSSVWLPGCAGSPGATRLANVEDLVGLVERVYVDSELTQQTSRGSIEALRALVVLEPVATGDAAAVYAQYLGAIQTATEQATRLEQSVANMKRAAKPVFEQWAADLGRFASPEMRGLSESRLRDARQRYDAIVAAIDPALGTWRGIATSLQDHAIFLGHDYNPSALTLLADDLERLRRASRQLDEQLADCLRTTHDYLATRAIPKTPSAPSDLPAAKPPAANGGL